MLKPLRLFLRSLGQFARAVVAAVIMALVCLTIQLVLLPLLIDIWMAIVPAKPVRPFVYIGPFDWRDEVPDSLFSTIGASVVFFFHALVALMATAWLLRSRAGFDPMPLLRRAIRGAALLACGAAIVFAAAFLLDDVLPATRYIRFDFSAAALVALWFGTTVLLLPARLMSYQPAVASGLARTTVISTLAALPWFYLSEIFGAPLRHCRDCGGTMDGGLFLYLMIAAYLFGLTVSSAAISAAACIPMEPRPAAATAA
ncbi:MAG TPA: hypothetical protein VGF48_13135 [Thermoanaerobaculia bacterium]|jgi:hypothetical protein